jgi:plastocyanin
MRPRAAMWLLALAVCLPAISVAAAGTAMVSQFKRAFTLRSLQIMAGDTVRFNNEDTFRHQIYVHSPAMTFDSDEQPPGTAVDLRFPARGIFEVRCHIHPKMLLVVDVQ